MPDSFYTTYYAVRASVRSIGTIGSTAQATASLAVNRIFADPAKTMDCGTVTRRMTQSSITNNSNDEAEHIVQYSLTDLGYKGCITIFTSPEGGTIETGNPVYAQAVVSGDFIKAGLTAVVKVSKFDATTNMVEVLWTYGTTPGFPSDN